MVAVEVGEGGVEGYDGEGDAVGVLLREPIVGGCASLAVLINL